MKSIKRIIGLLVGLVIMIWLLRKVDISKLGSSWRQINWGLIALGIGLSQVSVAARAVRWRYLLLETRRIGIRNLYSALIVGWAATWILPFRLGEMAGAYSLSRLEPVRFTTLMASVVADRILDILWLFGALIFVFFFFPFGTVTIPARLFGAEIQFSSADMIVSARFLGLLSAVVMSFLVTLYFRQNMALKLIDIVLKPLSPRLAGCVARLCRTFADGLHVLRNPRHFAMAILSTFVVWGVAMVGVYALLASFPFATEPTFRLAVLVLVSIAAGLTLPNAPGYVGTFHMAIILGLLMGNPSVDLDQAIGFAIIYHLTQFIPAMLFGLLFMWVDNLSIMPSRQSPADVNPLTHA